MSETRQLTIFGDAPARFVMSRRSDPATSHAAARKVVASGQLESHCSIILAMVAAHPDSTSAEIGQLLDVPNGRFVSARRLPDLRRRKLVETGPARACAVTGNQAMTWRVKGT